MFQKAFKTIVVGVDFSDYSKVVVKQAQLLSKLWKTKLVLVHAIHDPVAYSPSLYMSFPNIVSEKSYEERIQKTYKVVKGQAKIIARRGAPSSVLTQIAAKNSTPLILVGHKGHNRIEEFFFGSTAQSLALQSKIPVWIHRGTKLVKPQRVLIPHDLSKESNHSVDVIKKLNMICPLQYEVFHVKEKAFPVLDYQSYQKMNTKLSKATNKKIKNLLEHYPHLHLDIVDGDVTRKIVQKTMNFDLLVMAHHNPTGLFSKSETAELIKRVKTPILVTH